MQRWLLVSRGERSEPLTPPLPLPADCTVKVGVGAKLAVVSNLGQALRDWWQLRVGTIAAAECEPSSGTTQLIEQMMGARDAVRLAYLQRAMNLSQKRTNNGLQTALQAEMGEMGWAVSTLERFTQPARSSFLRSSSTPACPAALCGRLSRQPTDLSSYPTTVALRAAELMTTAGDCFAALDAKLNLPGQQEGTRVCRHCGKRGRFLEQPHTSVEAESAPALILLELPDDPPTGLPYDLRPNTAPRPLVVGGVAQGSYRLVGVLMYAKGFHFFVDVLDARERRWLRYDGMVADGVGQPVEPTGGAMLHGAPGRVPRRYYPTVAVYVREQ